jgi:hypothetical protein
MQGLSFREFLEIQDGVRFPTFTIDEILKNHINIAVSF